MAPAVNFDNVTKLYETETSYMTALDGVDLTIEPGKFISLIGPSGCGKSTLLRLAAGLEEVNSGQLTIHGVTPKEACSAKLVGLVPQTPALLPWLSVLDNVSLPQKINKGAARRRSDIEQLQDKTSSGKPDMKKLLSMAGLGEAIGKRPAQLSGGMQQRVAIVRAFGLQPDLLLMDEPFSALDEFTREALQDQLLDLWDELRTTVLFVTHSVSEAVRLSDTVVIMAPNPGRITDVIDIDLPRPRNAAMFEDEKFHEYENMLREKLASAWQSTSVA